jgi:hypothetical protein
MNLFRSNEHARRWKKFNPAFEKTFKPLSFRSDVFSGEMFRSRNRPDFISWLRNEEGRKAISARLRQNGNQWHTPDAVPNCPPRGFSDRVVALLRGLIANAGR